MVDEVRVEPAAVDNFAEDVLNAVSNVRWDDYERTIDALQVAPSNDFGTAGVEPLIELLEVRLQAVARLARGALSFAEAVTRLDSAGRDGPAVHAIMAQHTFEELMTEWGRLIHRDLAAPAPPGDGSRSFLVTDLDANDGLWGQSVGAGTISRGDHNVRYFDFQPEHGGGVIVLDWWIPTETSGVILKGDGRRGYLDPLTGMVQDGHGTTRALEITDSRVLIVLDLEQGRGSITQSESCTASWMGTSFLGGRCNEPREVSFDAQWTNDDSEDLTGEGINVDQTNQFDLSKSRDGSYTLTWDALNSIVPVGSVDGQLTLTKGENAYTSERTGDQYPSIAVTHYGQAAVPIVGHHSNEGLNTAIPFGGILEGHIMTPGDDPLPAPPLEEL